MSNGTWQSSRYLIRAKQAFFSGHATEFRNYFFDFLNLEKYNLSHRDQYLDWLEEHQPELAADWTEEYFESDLDWLLPRWEQYSKFGDFVSRERFLSAIIGTLGGDRNLTDQIVVRLWNNVANIDYELSENLLLQMKNRPSNLRRLQIIEDSIAPNPKQMLLLKTNLSKVQWLFAEDLDDKIKAAFPLIDLDKDDAWLFNSFRNDALHACSLTILRLANLMLNSNQTSFQGFLNELSENGSDVCPVHPISRKGLVNLARSLNVLYSDQVSLRRSVLEKLLKLAENSFKFQLSEIGLGFVYRGMKPHKWQESALISWAAHARNGIVQAATGAGKSLLGRAAIAETFLIGDPSVLLTHRRAIKAQWARDELCSSRYASDKFLDANSEFKIFNSGNVMELSSDESLIRRQSAVASPGKVLLGVINSVANADYSPISGGEEGVLVVDEVHQFGTGMGMGAINRRYQRKMGLTATIYPYDFNVRQAFGGFLVANYDIATAMNDEIICRYDLITLRMPSRIESKPFGTRSEIFNFEGEAFDKIRFEAAQTSFSKYIEKLEMALRDEGIKISAGVDFDLFLMQVREIAGIDVVKVIDRYFLLKRNLEKLADLPSNKVSALESIVPVIKQHGKTLIFSNSVRAGKDFSKYLEKRGVKPLFIDGNTDEDDRGYAFKQLEMNRIEALIAPRILDEGVNIPEARIGVFLGSGSGGYRQTIQRLGRILRKKVNHDSRALIFFACSMNGPDDPLKQNESFSRGSTFSVLEQHAESSHVFELFEVDEMRTTIDNLVKGS